METFFTSIVYQNQLFAEGLESVLQKNNYIVSKRAINKLKDSTSDQYTKTGLLVIEANWPFPRLENMIDEISTSLDENFKVILISNLINKSTFRLVYKGKIHGIVLKSSSMEELLFGMKQVMDGKTYYSSLVANIFLKTNTENQALTVSKREKQILSLLAAMNTTDEIADKLSITKSTVKTHRRNLMHKFNAKNLLCLLRTACRENLLNEENDFCGCCYKQLI